MATKVTTAIIEFDAATAEREISPAWQECKKTEKYGMEFGRVCCEWRDKFKAQGKKGQGLSPILEKVGVPSSTAYWWMDKYEVSIGAKVEPVPPGMPTECPVCGEKFPSKGKAQKHRNREHPVAYTSIAPAPMCPVCVEHPHQVNEPPPSYLMHPELQAQVGRRSHGMALSRLRPIAEGTDCKVGCTDGIFMVKTRDETLEFLKESEVREFLLSKKKPVTEAIKDEVVASIRIPLPAVVKTKAELPEDVFDLLLQKVQTFAPISSGQHQQIPGYRGIHRGYHLMLVAARFALKGQGSPSPMTLIKALEETAADFIELSKVLQGKKKKTSLLVGWLD
jgi:hypothetical protein